MSDAGRTARLLAVMSALLVACEEATKPDVALNESDNQPQVAQGCASMSNSDCASMVQVAVMKAFEVAERRSRIDALRFKDELLAYVVSQRASMDSDGVEALEILLAQRDSQWLAVMERYPNSGLPSAVPPLSQSVPLYTLVEELKIVSDESSPEKSLTSVTDLTLLADGSIVTAHASENLIRVYSATGSLIRAFGRRGQGPGEFSGLSRIGTIGDSIWTYDFRNRQVNMFTRDGTPVRSMRTVSPVVMVSGANTGRGATARTAAPAIHGVFGGGRKLVSFSNREPSASSPDQASVDSLVFAIHDSAGAVIHRLLQLSAPGRASITLSAGNFTGTTGQPLNPRSEALVSPGGTRMLIASDAEIFGGQPGQLRLSEVSLTGRVSHQVITLPAVRVSPNFADSMARVYASWMRTPSPNRPLPTAAFLEQYEKELRENIYTPQYHPVLRQQLLGRDGALWIDYKYDGQSWIVIADGRLVMRVSVPDKIRIHQVSRTHMWGVETDGNGLPIIGRYRLVRG